LSHNCQPALIEPRLLREDYLPTQLTSEDYPNLIAPGERVEVIASEAILARSETGTGPARTPHGASITANPTGHTSPQVVGPQGAVGCSRRIGSVPGGYANLGRRPQVTLRSATLHFARPAACTPRTA
jgi:hypothetical protein